MVLLGFEIRVGGWVGKIERSPRGHFLIIKPTHEVVQALKKEKEKKEKEKKNEGDEWK